MSFRIHSNETAFGLNQLRLSSHRMERGMERLSSGWKINRGADDPSGLRLSEGMRARLGGLQTAIQNIQDDLSLLRVAEGGIREAADMVQRMRDLAVRGGNAAVWTSGQLSVMNEELESLKDGLNQIAASTRFNAKGILAGGDSFREIDPANITVSDWAGGPGLPPGSGTPEYEAMKAEVLSAVGGSVRKVYGMLGIAPPVGATLAVNFTTIDGNSGILATGGGAPGAMQVNIDVYDFLDPDGAGPLSQRVGDDPSVHGFTVQMLLAHEMTHAILIGNGIVGGAWGQEMMASYVAQEGERRIGGSEAAEVYTAAQFINNRFGSDALNEIALEVAAGSDWDAAILTVLASDYSAFADFETDADAYGTQWVSSDVDSAIRTDGFGWTAPSPNITARFVEKTQLGPDANQRIDLISPWVAAGALDYLAYADVSTAGSAQKSIAAADRAVEIVARSMAYIGVQENRLKHALDDMEAEYINLSAARSRIQDADLAIEITELTRNQILRQTTLAAAAQNRISRETALDLIGRGVG